MAETVLGLMANVRRMYRRSAALADDPNGVGSRRLSGEIASTRLPGLGFTSRRLRQRFLLYWRSRWRSSAC